MKTIRVRSHVGKDGTIQLQLPDCHNEEVEVLVVYQPVQEQPKRQWSQPFLDLPGSWQGEPIERGSQDYQPEREPLL